MRDDGGVIYEFGACVNLDFRQTDEMAESTVGQKNARQIQSWAKAFNLGSLIMSSLLLSAGFLLASPQRPYIHELFGPELLISWPDGQIMHEEVMQLYYAGDYTAASQRLDKVIADAAQFSKAKAKDTAILLTTQAELIMLLGDTEEANTHLLSAQELADRLLPSCHPVTERIQSDRALVFLVRGNLAEARIALERAMASQAGRGGTNDFAYARNLNHKVLMCLAQGDPAQASVLIGQSSEIVEKVAGTQSPLYGQNELLKSLIAAAKGEYEKAVRLCESSLTTLTNCFGSEHLILVSVRKAFADNYQQLGMYEQAAPLLEANLQTLEKTIASDNIVLSGVLNSLGLLHYRLGNYADAELRFRRCLSVQENSLGVNSAGFAATVNNLTLVLIEMGREPEASKLFNEAVSSLKKSVGQDSPELATVLLNWSMFSRGLGDLDFAERLVTEADAIRNKAFGKDHPASAELAEEYARLECDRGNFNHALDLVSLAFSIKTNFYGSDHPAMADNFSTAAGVFAGMGNEHKAAQLYLKSAEISAKAFWPEHPVVCSQLEAASLVLCRSGEWAEALSWLANSLRLQRDYLSGQLTKAKAQDGLRFAGATFYRTELLHALCALSFSNATAPAQAAEQLANSKAMLEEVQATQASLGADSRRSTRERREKLDAIQTQLHRLPESNLGAPQREARRRQLQIEKTQIEEALAEWNQLVLQTIRERNLTLTDIARSLPPQSVLLDFIQYQRYDFVAKTNQWKEERYAAYLTFPLARDSTNVVVERVDLGEAAPINEAVEFICRPPAAGLSPDSDSAKKLEANCRRLTLLVYSPLAKHLTTSSHLIICPDGQLSRLPFEMVSVGNRFLVEEKTISYVTSGREAVRIASPKSRIRSPESKTKSSKSLVMGNPDFDLDLASARSSNSTVQLAGVASALRLLSRDNRGIPFSKDGVTNTEAEARLVAKLLGDESDLRLGADASKASLKAVVSPRVLHLATHGFFLPDQEIRRMKPLPSAWSSVFTRPGPPEVGTPNDWENPSVRCGIALAGANHYWPVTNTVPADGSLTGLEASLLNLQGTELVILSACKTGDGEVKSGEGVMSLRRAFRIAGAETVLASHWSVSDRATSRLMTEFMRRWRAGEPRAKAWREAQLALLRSKGTPEDFSNPYFWAAFTLTGQWN